MVTTTCKLCSGTIAYQPIDGLPFSLVPTICNACDEAIKAREAAEEHHRRFELFELLCPPLYQSTDPNHPGMPPAAKLSRVLNWQFGPRGLILFGQPRRGKTRTLWLLLKQLILAGRTVQAMTCGQFAAHCADFDNLGEWFSDLVAADVVAIDDLGKSKLTERVELELFNLMEFLTAHQKPMLFTSNYSGAELLARLSPERGPAIVGRIREFCDSICL